MSEDLEAVYTSFLNNQVNYCFLFTMEFLLEKKILVGN